MFSIDQEKPQKKPLPVKVKVPLTSAPDSVALNAPLPSGAHGLRPKLQRPTAPARSQLLFLKSTYCAFAACQLKIILVRAGVEGAEEGILEL